MRIHKHAVDLTNLFSLLPYLFISITHSNGQRCYDTGNFTTNSVYGENRYLILSNLASNVSANGGFVTATIGQDTNKVYALANCNGDYSLETCFRCVNASTQNLITNCPNQKEALSWGGDNIPCIVRYANRSFFGLQELDPFVAVYNTGNITMNLTQFDQTWEGLMDRLATKTSTGSFKLKFATEEANLTYFEKIYALMMCTSDLSQNNCDYCLRQSVLYYKNCCHGHRGGFVQRPICLFRWDLYPFYESKEDASSPSPPPTPSISPPEISMTTPAGGIEAVTVGIIVLSIIIFVSLVAFTCVLLRRRKAKHEKIKKQKLQDPIKRLLLVWEKRCKIIVGIAQGILYLHEDSRIKIIHRDLKASNILLDADMNPKISDFGVAKLFEMDQTRGDTSKIVGTFGYMAPEYVMHGQLSVKLDVFSFGVLVLEIISGHKNTSFCNGDEGEDLLTYAWRNWKEGTAFNISDPILRGRSSSEIMRSIHIGLLCVQTNKADRPTMTSVVLMLTSGSVSLSVPSKPAFYLYTTAGQDDPSITLRGRSKINNVQFTVNEASITELEPR
ncbi:cysteine-rich receptor-like protein kinase 17 [Pistacia vera]|uniref:cysteine-rich receptor-like protein kinase 17 n=1 Tax=Pistacia vera TaxID=55513 RepID=UPI00126389E0|nr:cysteine-rich receptor-like protein kinase 17 [Pistacia vera]